MNLLLLLIVVPLVSAFLMLVSPASGMRNFLVRFASIILIALSVLLLIPATVSGLFSLRDVHSELINQAMFVTEMGVALYILFASVRNWKFIGARIASVLILVQAALMTYFELTYGHVIQASRNLFIDPFSVIMAQIIGIVGTLICIYAIGYMKDFHEHHTEVKDQQNFFFFTLFIFLSAMFGVVFANNLLWLYFFWEITTICSFLLIGYKGDEVSRNNAFRALWMNLLGGLAFAAGIIYLYLTSGTVELDHLLSLGKSAALLPAVLITFAGMAKSAQFPFSSWLLGAMVAPTPVSALLHSSTMVKAGVYIAVRLAPVLQGTTAGFMIALVGGLTFLLASFICISQSDAKKVLAYSTVANLGLVILCAGIGTYEAVWAGILLIIFHAISKCLLFLCVGVVEHKAGSRNIEDMDTLIVDMPKVAVMMLIGMAGMFLAPFGMLISKWAVLRAIVDASPVLAIIIVFGSAATMFFWVKWMGKLITVINPRSDLEDTLTRDEWIPLGLLSLATIGVCGLFPLIAWLFIDPYLMATYGHTTAMTQGNIVIMAIMLALVMLFPLSFLNYGKNVRVVDPYLGGANNNTAIGFTGSAGAVQSMGMRNYYMEGIFGEAQLARLGITTTVIFLLVMLGVAIL